jgi:DNA sulfur modification protein DndD
MRPVVLFGGKNGAGKTTILEAIYLCLYGPLGVGIRTTKSNYKEYLRKRIHRAPSALLQSSSAVVELEFEHTHVGERSIYRLIRSWTQTGTGLDESLTVTRDGAPLDDLANDQWQEFVKDLLPPGLASLCFFDGERIQELAEDSSAEEALRASIMGLLGLDVVDRLRADLRLYISRTRRATGSGELADDLNALQVQREAAREQIAALAQDTAQTQTLLENAVSKQGKCEEALRRQGGEYALARGTTLEGLEATREKIAEIESEGRALAMGVLPFAVAPRLLERLGETLVVESETNQKIAARALVERELAALLRKAKGKHKPKGYPAVDGAEAVVEYVSEQLLGKFDVDGEDSVHGLSDGERGLIDAWVASSRGEVSVAAAKCARSLEAALREQADADQRLAATPDDDEVAPKHAELVEASQLVGRHQAELRVSQGKLQDLERAAVDVERQIDRLEKKIKTSASVEMKLTRAERTNHALELFRKKLVGQKVEELEQSFVAAYKHLNRKEDLIQAIRLDPENLSVSLEDRHGRTIDRSQLSAGEKQIYAISLLWALANCSGRPLPFVVDTPLGRLDSDHRTRLIEEYFPAASHQVIVLSTDTEVDESFYSALKPSLSHAYHLNFDVAEERTVVEEGYFWRNDEPTQDEEPARVAQ